MPRNSREILPTEDLFVGELVTDTNGNFTFSDFLTVSLNPGVYSLLLKHSAFELVADNSVIYDSWINVIDDSIDRYDEFLPEMERLLEQGQQTSIQGAIIYQNAPQGYTF